MFILWVPCDCYSSNWDGDGFLTGMVRSFRPVWSKAHWGDSHGLHRFWIRFSGLWAVHETAAGPKQDDPFISSQNMWQIMPVWSPPLSRCWGFSPSQGVMTKVEVRKNHWLLWPEVSSALGPNSTSRYEKNEKWNFLIPGVIFYYLQCKRNKQPQ